MITKLFRFYFINNVSWYPQLETFFVKHKQNRVFNYGQHFNFLTSYCWNLISVVWKAPSAQLYSGALEKYVQKSSFFSAVTLFELWFFICIIILIKIYLEYGGDGGESWHRAPSVLVSSSPINLNPFRSFSKQKPDKYAIQKYITWNIDSFFFFLSQCSFCFVS